MSWVQNWAGRAEDILNKIDKNAANILSDKSDKISVVNESSGAVDSNIQPHSNEVFVLNTPTKILIDNEVESTKTETPRSSKSSDNENMFEKTSFVDDSLNCPSVSSHNSLVWEDIQKSNEKVAQLEVENDELHKQVLNLQHLYSQTINENENLKSQLDSTSYLVKTLTSDLEQYKARTLRILQEKNNFTNSSDKDLDSNVTASPDYMEEFKKELQFEQNQNAKLNDKVKNLVEEIAFLKQQLLNSQNQFHQVQTDLERKLRHETKLRTMADDEVKLISQENKKKINEIINLNNVIKANDNEIAHLKEALKQKSTTFSVNDFESRIKSLTDTLLMKQSSLEQATTERNSLRLQLEKLEQEYHNNLNRLERAQVQVINVNDTDDVKSQVPQFLRVSPFDAGVTRRVKYAYSSLDAISIRTGIFLRRYPIARVCVFSYMVILQLWVLVVLFIYVPNSR